MIKTLLNDLLKKEGGYVNHPADRGGPTKYGITLLTLQNFRHRPVSIDDIKNLSLDEAFQIYRTMYYRDPKIDRINPEIQPIMLDMAVNHGPKSAIKMLQAVLRDDFSLSPGKIDGIIGPKTQQCVNQASKPRCNGLINALIDHRVEYYLQIIRRDPIQKIFEKGWINRAESFRPDGA